MFDQPPERPSPGPGWTPATPAQMWQLLKRDVASHIGKIGSDVAVCTTVQLLSMALQQSKSPEFSPAMLKDPVAYAMVEALGQQAGAFCHVFGDDAEAVKASLLVAIEDSFTRSRGISAALMKIVDDVRAATGKGKPGDVW